MPTSFTIQRATVAAVAAIPEGLGTAGLRCMFQDVFGNVGVFMTFGSVANGWNAIYVDFDSGNDYYITGSAKGYCNRSAVIHQTTGKLVGGTEYAIYTGSFWEFDLATQTYTTIETPVNTLIGGPCIGDDGYVYFSVIGNRFYSYEPVTETLKDYGQPNSGVGLDSGSNYIWKGADSQYLYCSAKLSGVDQHRIYYTPLTGNVNWQEWGNGLCYGQWVSGGRMAVGGYLYFRQQLENGSYVYWKCLNGVFTNLGSAPTQATDYSLLMSDYESQWESIYGYEVNLTELVPITDLQEYTKISWRISGGVWQETAEFAYTSPWEQQTTKDIVPLSGTEMFCIVDGCGGAFKIDYAAPLITYLGLQVCSPYTVLKDGTGEIYIGAYSNVILRYDPDSPWTMTAVDDDMYLPTDEGKPNPYRIYKPSAPLLHYRHGLDYDANGLIWIGGNTTRRTPNFGDVMWYNPANGDTGPVFPGWEAAGTQFRNLCAANNRSLVCVSDNIGNIWIVNAATQEVDPTPIRPTAGNSKTYMIEVSTNLVFGIVFESGTYKTITFNPSTKAILTLNTITASGTPFGFGDNEYARMNYRLILGPDGLPWFYIGSALYKYDTATNSMTKVADGTYGKMRLAANGTDLLSCANTSVINKLSIEDVTFTHYSAMPGKGVANFLPPPSVRRII